MLTTPLKRTLLQLLPALMMALLFFSCQKELSLDSGGTGTQLPDLSTKISSSVSGFVTDENNAPVQNATVVMSTGTILTDKYGYFEISNVPVVKNAAFITVSKPGYFKGIKTYIAKEGKSAFFRIKLIPKTIAGNINSTTGGSVTLTNGLNISLPAGAVVNAANNTVYTGTIHVAAYKIDPTAADLPLIMPGDGRGINTGNSLKWLKTFVMAAIELTGTSGELLQIATDKKATLTIPIPAAVLAAAPSSVPVWYFDESNGLWKEQSVATKTGNTYVGTVSHFSFWDWGGPGDFVNFECTVSDSRGNPVPNAFVKISYLNDPSYRTFGFTNSNGYVAGPIPDTTQLLMEIFSEVNCSSPVYSQPITTSGNNISLTIAIPNQLIAVMNGTLTDCNNAPVTNGYIIMQKNYYYYKYAVGSPGTFSINTVLCNSPTSVSIVGENETGLQYSNPYPFTLTAGNNALGNINACGNQVLSYVHFSINGTNYSLIDPPDYIAQTFDLSPTSMFLYGWGNTTPMNISFGFTKQNIAPNTIQSLTNFTFSQIADSFNITTPIPVNIVEYGNINQYVSGNFSGIMTSFYNPTVTYNVNCYFRMKRYY